MCKRCQDPCRAGGNGAREGAPLLAAEGTEERGEAAEQTGVASPTAVPDRSGYLGLNDGRQRQRGHERRVKKIGVWVYPALVITSSAAWASENAAACVASASLSWPACLPPPASLTGAVLPTPSSASAVAVAASARCSALPAGVPSIHRRVASPERLRAGAQRLRAGSKALRRATVAQKQKGGW